MELRRRLLLARTASLFALGALAVSPALAQQATPSAQAAPSGAVGRAGTDAGNVGPAAPQVGGPTPGRTAASPDVVAGIPVNYDESKIPKYVLPDALTFNNGSPVRNAADWTRRRAELVALFEENQHARPLAGRRT